jgi:hypothetical protein
MAEAYSKAAKDAFSTEEMPHAKAKVDRDNDAIKKKEEDGNWTGDVWFGEKKKKWTRTVERNAKTMVSLHFYKMRLIHAQG